MASNKYNPIVDFKIQIKFDEENRRLIFYLFLENILSAQR